MDNKKIAKDLIKLAKVLVCEDSYTLKFKVDTRSLSDEVQYQLAKDIGGPYQIKRDYVIFFRSPKAKNPGLSKRSRNILKNEYEITNRHIKEI